jgi:hypothetical protein
MAGYFRWAGQGVRLSRKLSSVPGSLQWPSHLVAGASVLSRDAANAPQEARVSGVTLIRIGSVRRTAAEVLFRFVRATPQIHRASSRKVEMRPEVLGCGRHLGRSPNIPQFKTSRMNHERVWVDLRALLCLLCLGLMAR